MVDSPTDQMSFRKRRWIGEVLSEYIDIFIHEAHLMNSCHCTDPRAASCSTLQKYHSQRSDHTAMD